MAETETKDGIIQMLLNHIQSIPPLQRMVMQREADMRYKYHYPYPPCPRTPAPSLEQNEPLGSEKEGGGVLVDNGHPPVTLAQVDHLERGRLLVVEGLDKDLNKSMGNRAGEDHKPSCGVADMTGELVAVEPVDSTQNAGGVVSRRL